MCDLLLEASHMYLFIYYKTCFMLQKGSLAGLYHEDDTSPQCPKFIFYGSLQEMFVCIPTSRVVSFKMSTYQQLQECQQISCYKCSLVAFPDIGNMEEKPCKMHTLLCCALVSFWAGSYATHV